MTEAASSTNGVYGVDENDPRGELIDRAHFSPDVIAEVSELMAALGELRAAEEQLTEASMRYMQLGKSDMRAIHLLIVAENRGELVTPGAIAAHLGITTPSTTKLLDRLERGGHVTRAQHPGDRRASVVSVTPETRKAATRTVGAQQAKRFQAAAALSSDQRATVTAFLRGMTNDLSLDGVEWAQEPNTAQE